VNIVSHAGSKLFVVPSTTLPFQYSLYKRCWIERQIGGEKLNGGNESRQTIQRAVITHRNRRHEGRINNGYSLFLVLAKVVGESVKHAHAYYYRVSVP
jgi:hypothetical protein